MTEVLVIMIVFFVFLAIFFMIKIKNTSLKFTKSLEINNKENEFDKKYQFIKGLF
jgi:hypothetical protein